MTASPTNYRRNVAIVVVNEQGFILACHRSDVEGAWQLPQGGIEADETDEQAMYRELEEEIGVSNVEILDRLDKPIVYEWPPHLHSRGFLGQEQIYFLVKLLPNTPIVLDGHEKIEFDRVEWTTIGDFLSRTTGFKTEAYRKALQLFFERQPERFSESNKA